MFGICDCCSVNLKRVTPDQAKRIVDFLYGTIYAIGGDIQKLGGGIFLCTPNNVNVELSAFNYKITEATFKLEFMQMEAVTDKVKPRKLVAFFVNDKGQKISYEVPIIANSTDKDAKNRLITEKFTLRSGDYKRDKDYFLVLADMEDERIELHRYKFTIDIADM